MEGLVAIIPAAGKGTRVGTPADGKELMLDPMTGRPLIDFAILAAMDAGADKIIVAIEDGTKPLLRSHIMNTFPEVIVQSTKPEGEWPSTVLQTAEHWDLRDNILILPDTRFNAEELTNLVGVHSRTTADITFGLQPGPVMEPDKFGIVGLHEYSSEPEFTVEKPSYGYVAWPNIAAWGLLAFDKEHGEQLFQTYIYRDKELSLKDMNVNRVTLSWFKDITRNGYVETY